jgi:tetratricopeptide (TPR) repeat protein
MQGILNFLAHIPAKEQFLAAAILIFVFWILSKYLFQNEPILRLVVHLWPKSARAHFSLGYFLHRKSKSLEEAEKEIRIAIELKPKFRDAYVILLPLSVANGDENVGQEKYENFSSRWWNFSQMMESLTCFSEEYFKEQAGWLKRKRFFESRLSSSHG